MDRRYGGSHALPAAGSGIPRAKEARQNVYGFLLGSVHPNGSIDFGFQEIKREDIPATVGRRYTPEFVDYCFEKNTDFRPPAPGSPGSAGFSRAGVEVPAAQK